MNYLNLIISFIVGGGLTALTNWGISKRSSKVDFADKAIKFTEDYSVRLMNRVAIMEGEIKQLSKFKCERSDCDLRLPLKMKK